MTIKRFFCVVVLLLITLTPLFSDDPLSMAKKYYDQKRYDKALELYSQVKTTYAGSDWDLKAHIMSARIYEYTGRTDHAVNEYKKIMEKFPGNEQSEEAFFMIARLRMIRGEKTEAVNAYKAYLEIFKKGNYRAAALFNLAAIYRDNNKPKTALKYYFSILKNHPNELWFHSWAAIYAGHIFMSAANYDRAIENYQRVIKSDENKFLSALSLLHIGQAYMEKKEYGTAEAVFQNILKTYSVFSEEALYGLAKAHYKAGNYETAKEVLASILQMFPKTIWRHEIEAKLKEINKKLKK